MRKWRAAVLLSAAVVIELTLGVFTPHSISCFGTGDGPVVCSDRPWVRMLWLAVPLVVIALTIASIIDLARTRRDPARRRNALEGLVVIAALILLMRPAFVLGSVIAQAAPPHVAQPASGTWQCNAAGYCLAPFDAVVLALSTAGGAMLAIAVLFDRPMLAPGALVVVGAIAIAFVAWESGRVSGGFVDFFPVVYAFPAAIAAFAWTRRARVSRS